MTLKRHKIVILALVLIFCFAAGCQDREAIAALEDFKAQAEIEEQNIELAKRYLEAFNQGNFEALKGLLSPDYGVYSPSGYPERTSREKLIENYMGARKTFPVFAWNLADIIAAKDKVVCRIIAKGTYKGGVPAIPVAEKEFTFSMITIMRIANGKIVEEWQEDDQLGLVRQLGMELKPKEGEK
jgi:steroid delta-isomerase-like uncharacterized protein